jgi:hypothetical protein
VHWLLSHIILRYLIKRTGYATGLLCTPKKTKLGVLNIAAGEKGRRKRILKNTKTSTTPFLSL